MLDLVFILVPINLIVSFGFTSQKQNLILPN